MEDVDRVKARYARLIEDGRKIEVFTSMPEWQWYVEHVLTPTIDENIEKIIKGEIESEKAEWVIKGMVQGLRMVTDAAETMKLSGDEAKQKAKDLAKYQKALEDEDRL